MGAPDRLQRQQGLHVPEVSISATTQLIELTKTSTEGVIPETALQTLTSKKYILPGDKPPTADGDADADMEEAEKALDSDDEDAALEGLSKEELEG